MGANRLDRRSVPSVGYIVRSYPRLSQTFILGEIRALERLGVPIQFDFARFALRGGVYRCQGAAPVAHIDQPGPAIVTDVVSIVAELYVAHQLE